MNFEWLNRFLENRNKFIDSYLLLIIWVLFQWFYPVFVVENYSFMGYYYVFNPVSFFLANSIVFLLVFLLPDRDEFTFFVSVIFLLFLVMPNAVLFAFHPEYHPVLFFFVVFFYLILWFILDVIPVKSCFIERLPSFSGNISLYVLLLLGVVFVIPFFLRFRFNIYWNVLLFKDIYKIREVAGEKSTQLMGYLFSNLVKVVFPVGMILALSKKKYFIFFLFFILQFYLFLVEAHKSVFLSLFLIPLFFINGYRKQVRIILVSLIFLFLSSHFLYVFKGMLLPESILYRRAFLTPALLNICYFDIFYSKPVFLSYTFLHVFFEYPYNLAPPNLVGLKCFGAAHMSANNGFISDGFANFGFMGIIVYSILLALYFKLLHIFKVPWYYSGVLIIVVYTFLSSSFTTSLITHGMLLFILLVMFILKR